MKARAPLHRVSRDWVRTIEQDKGYAAIDTVSFKELLGCLRGYALYRALLRHVSSGQSVLEAGCGWAVSSFALAAFGARVTALDISEKLVDDLRKLKAELGGAYDANLRVVAGDIFRLRELDRPFDAVFSDGTYEHFLEREDRRSILENVRAVLKDGGKHILAVPNLNNPFFRPVVGGKMPAMKRFDLKELCAELEEAGFRVLETGHAFVNPGFEQWVRARWMIWPVRWANTVFNILPGSFQSTIAAHLYCVTQKLRFPGSPPPPPSL